MIDSEGNFKYLITSTFHTCFSSSHEKQKVNKITTERLGKSDASEINTGIAK